MKKQVIVVSLIIGSFLLGLGLVLIVYLISNDSLSDTRESVQTQTQEIIDTEQTTSETEEEFAREIVFEDANVKLSAKIDNLHPACDSTDYELVPMELERYIYENTNDEESYDQVTLAKNMDLYRNRNSTLQEGFDFLDSLLSAEDLTSIHPNEEKLEGLFGTSCNGGNQWTPVVYKESVDYLGTKSAIAILTYGSLMSADDSEHPYVQIRIFSKIGDDYISIYSTPGYSKDLSFLENPKLLSECEVESKYGYSYVPINEDSGKECLEKVYREGLDAEALGKYVEEILYKFRLDS